MAAPNMNHHGSTRIYISSLPYQANVFDVLALLKSHNFSIIEQDITFSTDPFTGRNPGYCFVNLPDQEDAARAINILSGQEVIGRPVKVNYDDGRRQRNPMKHRVKHFAAPSEPEGASNESKFVPVEYTPTFDRWQREDAEHHCIAPVEEGRRVRIGHLPRIEPHSAFDDAMQEGALQWLRHSSCAQDHPTA